MRQLVIIVILLCGIHRSADAQVPEIMPDKNVLMASFSAEDEVAFQYPDKVFYPETWFHFIGSNLSKEGIVADLQAIADAGISGVQWFHGDFGEVWPGMERKIMPLGEEWKELVRFVGRKADSLGLRMTVQTCPGWSMAGGPWIKPKDAMRKLVWSRTDIPSGRLFDGRLPKGQPSDDKWRDYEEITVLAFPTPLGDSGAPLIPVVTASTDSVWKSLIEGTNEGNVILQPGTYTVEFTLPDKEVLRTLSMPPVGALNHHLCYDPGVTIKLTAKMASGEHKVLADAELPMSNWQDEGSGSEMDFACNEVYGTENYTLTFTNKYPATLQFLKLYSAARKNSWRGEAGWSLIAKEPYQQHTDQNPLCFVRSEDIVVLSEKMDSDGRITWNAPQVSSPEQKWTLLRIGHVNAGIKNSPAPPDATGWECTKLDPRGAEIQFANYVGMLQDGPLEGKASGMLMDSWECYTQTWTNTLLDDFKSLAGYDLLNRLPALMGYVIDSQEETSRFLIDWRRTVNRLYCDNFFKRMTELAHDKGLDVQYETAGGDVVTMDIMEYMKYADVPMCEFWSPLSDTFVGTLEFKPIKPTASAAHLYGKTRVAAEGFTSFFNTWDEHWQMLKEIANRNLAEGVSHVVFHTYTHNPYVDFLKPGSGFSKWGTPFVREQTWWKYMPYFTAYLARAGYMLERGRPVADVLWYLGDEVGHKPYQATGNGKIQKGHMRFPEGYKYDYCNPDILLNRLSVKDGCIVTPEGVTYKVLWIPENERMLPETIDKIGELIRSGARVISNAPQSPATLNKEIASRFEDSVAFVWGKTRSGKLNRLGKGYLAVGMELSEALKKLRIKPHFQGSPDIMWMERSIDGARWYYIASPIGEGFEGTISLEGSGKAEWWNPVDGSVKPLKTKGWGRMKKVHLDLAQAESGFVVFRSRKSLPAKDRIFEQKSFSGRILPENWTVTFPDGWGVPNVPVHLKELKPWKELMLGDEGRAFSGTARYEATFTVTPEQSVKNLVLDLGEVDMIADIKVNGKSAGVLWAQPYRIPIGDLVCEGENQLIIDVTSTWFNRLVYDSSIPAEQRKTWTTSWPEKDSQLRNSGLIGPVGVLY